MQAPSTAQTTTPTSGTKSSCAWAQRAGYAQGTLPRALPGSATTIGCFSHQRDALNCHPQRGDPADLAAESVPKRATTCRWSAVVTPRDAGLRADDAVTSHRAADGAVPSIEGARTYAHFISRGAMAGFAAFLSAMTNSFCPRALPALAEDLVASPTKRVRILIPRSLS